MALEDTLRIYLYREAIYLEDDVCCLVVVVSVKADDKYMRATLRHVPASPVCQFRRIRHINEDLVEAWNTLCPFGEQWEISTICDSFYLDDTYWDGSRYAGFRLIFEPSMLQRFRDHDMSWIEDFFG